MKIDGRPVIDAVKPITLTITRSDVQRGKTKEPGSCAAAIACRRQLRAVEARVHIGMVFLKTGSKWTRYQTSPALRTEIVAFDRGGSFEPGEYTIKPVSGVRRFGARKQTQSGGPRKTKGPKRLYHMVAGIRPRASAGMTYEKSGGA